MISWTIFFLLFSNTFSAYQHLLQGAYSASVSWVEIKLLPYLLIRAQELNCLDQKMAEVFFYDEHKYIVIRKIVDCLICLIIFFFWQTIMDNVKNSHLLVVQKKSFQNYYHILYKTIIFVNANGVRLVCWFR